MKKLLEEWMLSSLVPIVKEKGDPLNPNSYRGIKLLEHAFKLYEKILDGHLCEVVDIDKMQYGFMPGREAVDAVFVHRRLSEKFRAKDKLFFIFVDLEKAFDRVAREVICFALRQKGFPEYLVNGAMSLYKGCYTAISVDGGTIKFIFCESWCPLRVFFESTFIYHGNGCSDGRCEGSFINGVVLCRRSCFVWGTIK